MLTRNDKKFRMSVRAMIFSQEVFMNPIDDQKLTFSTTLT